MINEQWTEKNAKESVHASFNVFFRNFPVEAEQNNEKLCRDSCTET
jgi:hypothetical protein